MVIEFESISVAIHASANLIVTRVVGTPQSDEFQQVAQRSIAHRAQGSEMRALVDLSGLTGTHLTSSHIRAYLTRLDAAVAASGPQTRVAVAFFAATGSLGYAMARMFHAHASGLTHLEVEIFDMVDAAEAWGGVPGALTRPEGSTTAAISPIDHLRAESARSDKVLTALTSSDMSIDAKRPHPAVILSMRHVPAVLQPLLQGIKLRNT
jgi:hypothetical protein